MSLRIGQPAPDFTLYNSEQQPVKLSDLQGRPVVLLFFPLAFTSTCTEELCGVRDNLSAYENLDAQVIGISVDSSQTLARYKQDQKLNFMLLSDFNKDVSRAYDTIYETFGYDMKGVSKRSAFVIDKSGNMQHAEVLENAGEIPDLEKVIEVLKETT